MENRYEIKTLISPEDSKVRKLKATIFQGRKFGILVLTVNYLRGLMMLPVERVGEALYKRYRRVPRAIID